MRLQYSFYLNKSLANEKYSIQEDTGICRLGALLIQFYESSTKVLTVNRVFKNYLLESASSRYSSFIT